MSKHREATWLKYCQLPKGTNDWTFAKYQLRDKSTEEAWNAASKLASDLPEVRWLTIMADVDRGKSHLAVAICKRWLKQGRPARYAYVPTLLDELRSSMDKDCTMPYHQQFDFFCKVGLLVLDDLGREKPSGWVKERLEAIVDYRYREGLPLVVTTNQQLPKEEGDKDSPISWMIASRLQRIEGAKVVVIEAGEFRKEKGSA